MTGQHQGQRPRMDRYATNLFYGGQQERPHSLGFGLPGQPTMRMAPASAPRPAGRPAPVAASASAQMSGNWSQDGVAMSVEVSGRGGSGNAACQSSPRLTGILGRTGDAAGPVYRYDVMSSLDLLLNGLAGQS